MYMDGCNVNTNNYFFKKWKILTQIIIKKKKFSWFIFIRFINFINWAIWIYAVASEKIIDASFGYFIMPIISVLLDTFFLKKN